MSSPCSSALPSLIERHCWSAVDISLPERRKRENPLDRPSISRQTGEADPAESQAPGWSTEAGVQFAERRGQSQVRLVHPVDHTESQGCRQTPTQPRHQPGPEAGLDPPAGPQSPGRHPPGQSNQVGADPDPGLVVQNVKVRAGAPVVDFVDNTHPAGGRSGQQEDLNAQYF